MIEYKEFKRFFIFNLVISLIVTALVAVVSVLIGDFTDTLGRVLFTLLMIVVHSLVALLFIGGNERRKSTLSFFINTIFFLIILSFLTSIFGTWDLIDGNTVGHIYQTFLVLAFAALHGDILSKALHKEGYIDFVVIFNYLIMVIVVGMLMPVIFLDFNVVPVLGEFFLRALGAAAIIDGTLTILTIIFYRLHLHNHPKAENALAPQLTEEQLAGMSKTQQTAYQEEKREGLSIWVWILIIYLIIQIGIPLAGLFFGFIF